MTKQDKDQMGKKFSSRRFIIVIWIMALISFCVITMKLEWAALLTVLAGGLTAYLGVSTFFKEKNFPQGGGV